MSNVVKDKDDLLLLKDFIKQIDKKEVDSDTITNFINEIAPKKNGIQLTKPIILPNGNTPAYFLPNTNSVNFSINILEEFIKQHKNECKEAYKIKDENALRNYLYLYVMLHEVEHSYQYLMSSGEIEAPNNLIKDGYYGIFNLNAISQIIYEKHRYEKYHFSLILERNAIIESDDALCQLAELEEHDEIREMFFVRRNMVLKYGYQKNANGSLEETYRKLLMYHAYKKFDKNIDCSEEERIRLGLNITEEARQKVLSLPIQRKGY